VAEEAGSHQVGDWISLGGTLERGAAVASWGDGGECELFAIHDDGELRDRYWDGKVWVPWEIVGAPRGDSASSTWSGDRLDVFVSRGGGPLWYRALE
jgi:hypothetical protein